MASSNSKKRALEQEDGDFKSELPVTTNPALLSSTNLPPNTPLPLPAGKEADLRLVLGSYERFLYGIDAIWEASNTNNQASNSTTTTTSAKTAAKEAASSSAPSGPSTLPTLSLHPRFIHPAHTACIKSLALHPKSGLLASGSTDETIRIHNLNKKKELGTLAPQKGTVTALQFAGAYLVAASEDGSVDLYRKKDWECVKEMSSGKKGKNKPGMGVRDLAVHPSGRLALGVGADGYLRLWDLTLGRLSLTTRLDTQTGHPHTPSTLPFLIRFNPSGSHFLLLSQSTLEIRALFPQEGAEARRILQPPKNGKFTTAEFLPENGDTNSVIAGLESGSLLLYSPKSPEPTLTLTAHTGRVKLLSTLLVPHPTLPSSTLPLLTTAASTGLIHIYPLPLSPTSVPIATYDTRMRPTCIVMQSVGKTVDVEIVKVEERRSRKEEKRVEWVGKMNERKAGEKRKLEEEEEVDDSDSESLQSDSSEELPRPKHKKRAGKIPKMPHGMPRKPGPGGVEFNNKNRSGGQQQGGKQGGRLGKK